MLKLRTTGNSLVFQWLRLCTYNAEDLVSIPSQGTRIPHASGHDKKKTNNYWFQVIQMTSLGGSVYIL